MNRPRPDHAVTTRVRIPLHHCDLVGVAWYGRYYEWIEEARTALFRSRDLDIPDIRDLGFKMFVTETRCRNMTPIRYGDELEVIAWYSAVVPLIRVAYDIVSVDTGRWAARATTVLAVTDADGNLLPQTPDAMLERLPQR